jgi:membrane protein implicated in regulation of membrane protease activity
MTLTFENFVYFILIAFVVYELIEHIIIPVLGYLWGKRSPNPKPDNVMVGKLATVIEWKAGKGLVRVNGEFWQAFGPGSLSLESLVIIENIEGLKLGVRPFENNSSKRGE